MECLLLISLIIGIGRTAAVPCGHFKLRIYVTTYLLRSCIRVDPMVVKPRAGYFSMKKHAEAKRNSHQYFL